MTSGNRPTGWGGPAVEPPGLVEVKAAAERIAGVVVRTPLVPMHSYDAPLDILLKPEVLQPIGSFKLRGAYNWGASLSTEERMSGLVTVSAGNTAQAVGFVAQRLGVPARTLLPDWVAANKLRSIMNYGVTPVQMPLDELVRYMFEEKWRQEPYAYLNPWADRRMMAGSGTIGLEIVHDWPDVESVYVPVGGGGLIAGIASALKALKPAVRVIAVQTEANPTLAAARASGGPVWVEHQPTICEGTGAPVIAAEMYPLLRRLVDDVKLVSEASVKAAIRILALGNKLVVEGAGALSVAAALDTPAPQRGKAVCILSGGSIDADLLMQIMAEDRA